MKQKLLFFAPNHFDIDLVILNQLEKMDNYCIVKLISKKYQYKNIFERIQNFIGKIFLNKTLKNEWKAQLQLQQIKESKSFDVCLIFRPDLLHSSVLSMIKEQIPRRKVVYWDSFQKVPALKNTLMYFNDFYSFEKEDCKTYHLKQITNFYFQRKSDKTPEYDAFFLGSRDSRLDNIIKVITYLKSKKWNAKALLVGKKKKLKDETGVEIIQTGIPFSQSYRFTENTKIVIDIAHPNQKGLSMRPFEALGLHRKLITNNENIRSYDFYDENNVFICTNFDNLNIPDSFLKTPYQELPEDIYKKYHISHWLQNILD